MEGTGLVSGLIDSTTSRLPRFSQVISQSNQKSFESFAILASNAEAWESTRLFALKGAPFVALVGPSGCGKTHLMESASSYLQAEFIDPVEVQEAINWARSPMHKYPASPLILDNVQDAMERGRVRQQLRLLLERRVKANRPTLLSFTAPRPLRSLRSLLPAYKDWIVSSLEAPNGAEREILVKNLAAAQGLILSDCVVWLLAHRMQGNASTLSGALKKLRLAGAMWNDPKQTLQACALLNPYFADVSSWDLRDHIVTCAEEFQCNLTDNEKLDLSIFTMMKVAELGEVEAAHFLEMEPAVVYSRAVCFEKKIAQELNCDLRDEALNFLRFTVRLLRR